MILIRYMNAQQEEIASASAQDEALLVIDRACMPGDVIEITSPARHILFQPDPTLLPARIYKPKESMLWPVPSGEHLLAYHPAAFRTGRQLIRAAVIPEEKIGERRNIACDPADLRGGTSFYPHCTANVETRNESCFAARNVIDGMRYNTYHGEWPYQSWGIGAREDAYCTLDFGREVQADEMALTLRADFPHDAYWTAGHVILSDGADIAFTLRKTGERQRIPLGTHIVSWMRLERLRKSDDPSAFPALRQWEVYGCDLKEE